MTKELIFGLGVVAGLFVAVVWMAYRLDQEDFGDMIRPLDRDEE